MPSTPKKKTVSAKKAKAVKPAAPKKKPAAAKARKPKVASVKATKPAAPAKVEAAPAAKAQAVAVPDMETVVYRGAVPLRSFIGWVVLVIGAAVLIGVMASNLLVDQRLGQLVQDTATRVRLQDQGRTLAVAEWLAGVVRLSNGIENADIVKIFASDAAGYHVTDRQQAVAVQAQKPYMQQMLREFVAKNNLQGAQLVLPDGTMLLSEGVVSKALVEHRDVMKEVVAHRAGGILPLREAKDGIVMDVLRPIFGMSVQDANAPVVAVLWFSLPVSDKLGALTAATPLDRPGERTVLLQHADDHVDVVGNTSLATLNQSYSAFETNMTGDNHSVSVVRKSVVDGKPVFAAVRSIPGSPLMVMQEYDAEAALGLMNLYKPGIYIIMSLLMLILAALMLAVTLHLMGQRNKTRVKLLGQTMEALVRVVEARDPYLAGHHNRVARLSVQVGNTLGMGVGERATLYYAAQLASVGRLLVPGYVLVKKGRLTTAERKDVEDHVQQAVTILGDLEFDLPIVPVISQMYERVDGSGHPLGLKGPQMSRMSKVLGACDAYVAMTSDRAHRKAMSKADALGLMKNGAFEDEVVKAIRKVA